jgi:hypothetical protein
MSGSRSPMIDAVNRRITQPCLEPFRVFSQIMKQPDHLGFGRQMERCSESFGKAADRVKVIFQKLPSRDVRIGPPVRQRRSMGVEIHSGGVHIAVGPEISSWMG